VPIRHALQYKGIRMADGNQDISVSHNRLGAVLFEDIDGGSVRISGHFIPEIIRIDRRPFYATLSSAVGGPNPLFTRRRAERGRWRAKCDHDLRQYPWRMVFQ